MAGFEPIIPTGGRPQTQTLGCAAFKQLPQFAMISYHKTSKDLKYKCGSLGPVSVVRDTAMLLLVTVRNEKFRGQGVKQWDNI